MHRIMLVVLIVGLLYHPTAWACGSYEKCMASLDKPYVSNGLFVAPDGRFKSGGADSVIDLDVAYTLKAIAYEIHEIKELLKDKELEGWDARVT